LANRQTIATAKIKQCLTPKHEQRGVMTAGTALTVLDADVCRVIYAVIIGLNVLVTAPLTIYYLRQIWLLRHKSFFRKRYPKLTILCAMSFIFTYLFLHTTKDIPIIFPSHNTLIPGDGIVYDLCFDIPFALCLLRGWFLYFDYSAGLHIVAQQWSSKLNDDGLFVTDTDAHWTVKYARYLNHKSKVPMLIAMAWTAASGGIHHSTLYALCFLPIVVFGLFLVCKVRSCRDQMFIRQELQLQAMLILIIMLIDTTLHAAKPTAIVVTALYCAMSIIIALESYVWTKWSIRKYTQRESIMSAGPLHPDHAPTLGALLQHPDGFDLFADFLVSEISIENLLFLFEAGEFIGQCIRWQFVSEDDLKVDLKIHKVQSSRCSDASVLAAPMGTFLSNVFYLFARYIDTNAQYSINISWRTRRDIGLVLKRLDSQHTTPGIVKSPIVLAITSIIKTLSASTSNSKVKKKRIAEDVTSPLDDVPLEMTGSNSQFAFPLQSNTDVRRAVVLVDLAMQEILSMVQRDSYQRFLCTAQFKQFFTQTTL